MKTKHKIKKATEGDRIFLLSLIKADEVAAKETRNFFWEFGDNFTTLEYIEEGCDMYVCWKDEHIVGYFIPELNEIGSFLDIRKDYRKQGIGSALFDFFVEDKKEYFSDKTFNVLSLSKSYDFWLKMGFIPCSNGIVDYKKEPDFEFKFSYSKYLELKAERLDKVKSAV